MKYQNLKSFQKHLTSAAPHNLCHLYLIAIADDFERLKAMDFILSHFSDPPNRLSAVNSNLCDILDSIGNMSLFGPSIVLIDEIEKFSKKELEVFSEHLKEASSFILIGTRSKVVGLSSVIEKEGVVLDLLDEKPWDKEKRLTEALIDQANKAGKKLSSEAAAVLLERLGADSALNQSEMDKLICYVGDRSVICQEDILAISPLSKASTLWQVAEEVIWDGGEFPQLDSAGFHAMIPALRSQLHLGLCLATLIEEKRPSDEWGQFLPKLWPKTLEKRSSQSASLGSRYFQKGLEKLFEIELLSRTHSTQYSAMLDLFRAWRMLYTHAR